MEGANRLETTNVLMKEWREKDDSMAKVLLGDLGDLNGEPDFSTETLPK